MGLGSVVKSVASKAGNKVKNGVKNKLQGKGKGEEAKEQAKQAIKRVLLIKVGIPAAAIFVLLACVSIILQQLFEDTSSSISVSSKKIKDKFEAGELPGDAAQINLASSLQEQYGSCIGFTNEQIKMIYDDTIKDLEGQDATYSETYTSNYGTITQEKKNDIVNKYNEVKDKENKRDEDYDIINYYKLSRDGKFNNMISPYDKQPIYMHALNTEKYNFNNIKWKAYYHNSDEVNDVPKDNMTYDTTYSLLYPTANANLKDLINLTAPYTMTSHIPLAFISSAMYSSSMSSQSIGNSWVQQNENAAQGKNNNIGNFSYEIIKHGYSDITINQYNLQSVTRSSYWLDYDIYDCRDSFTIVKTISTYTDEEGNEVKEAEYSVQPGSYKDGTTNLSGTPAHNNTRWDDAHNEVPANETTVSDPAPVVATQYKLAYAAAFDVKINNSFDYQKYQQEDVDKRENCDSTLSELESEHKKIEDENTHLTLDEVNRLTSSQLRSLCGDDGSTDSGGTYSYSTNIYKFQTGKRHDITRYWTDTVSSNPISQSKNLFGTGDIASYNKNPDEDITLDTISEKDFNGDAESKKYYEQLAKEEETAINRIDMLNANPKVFLKYTDNGHKRAKYVGYSRSDYTVSQGLQYLTEYLADLSEKNNGTLPFVYGASFGFDVNATAASGLFGGASGLSLLREYINSWEPVNGYMRTESGAPTNNEDEAKYYVVFLDSVGVPTVGYGININAHFSKIVDAMKNSSIDFPYSSASEIKSKVSSGEVVMMDKTVIDSVQEKLLQSFVDSVKGYTSGIELKEYQLFALTDRAYNGWNPINGKTFSQAYSEYWNQEKDDKYSSLFDKYKDNQGAKDSIISEIDFNNPLYVNFMQHTTGNASVEAANGGWTKRRKSEFILFSGGYFVGGYSMNSMLKFWTQTSSPGNIQLIKSDGTVDETACYNLQLWYEQNWFSNKFHAGTNMHVYKSCPTGGHNNDPLGALNPEMMQKYEPPAEVNLRYQCSWWSCVRANMFLVDNNTGKYIYGTPNGKLVASTIAGRLGLEYNTNIDNIRPNSLISWTSSSSPECGHTGYVEAVAGDYYITSECGSGKTWGGIIIHSKSADRGKFVGSVCLEDLVH